MPIAVPAPATYNNYRVCGCTHIEIPPIDLQDNMDKNAEKLSCISIIVCDDVYRDERTKKLVIVGTFNQITAVQLPSVHPSLNVVFSLTNGRGKYDLRVSVEHETTGEVAVEFGGPIEFTDPLSVNEVNIVLGKLVFKHAGKYWITITSDGEVLQMRPFFVKLATPKGES